MVMNTARRVREGLAELIRLVNDPATSTADLQAVLGECKTYGAQLTVLQADAATGLAVRERHGDGGVGVLAQAAGLSRRDAAGQTRHQPTDHRPRLVTRAKPGGPCQFGVSAMGKVSSTSAPSSVTWIWFSSLTPSGPPGSPTYTSRHITTPSAMTPS